MIHDTISKPNYRRKLHSKLTQDAFENVTGRFSFISYIELKASFDREYFYKKIKKIQEITGHRFDIDKFLYDLKVHVPILSEDDGMYSFSHISIQEYWCVKFIAELSKDKSKEKAYTAIKENLSNRLSYQIDNFAKLCFEMDRVNYEQYFYIPSLRQLREAIYHENIETDREEYYIAYYFLLNLFEKILVDSNIQSNYLLPNSKYSSLIFILRKDFPRFDTIKNKIYRYLSSNYFISRYFSEKHHHVDDNNNFIVKLIVDSNPYDIIKSINDLIEDVSIRINMVSNDIEKTIKLEDNFIDDMS